MVEGPLISNERDAAKARRSLDRMAEIRSGGGAIELSKAGFSDAAIQQFRRTVEACEKHLSVALGNYQTLKSGTGSELISNLANDPGSALILARIHRDLTQAELASALGLKEQQIQRYEAERYRSISLANLRKIAEALGVTFVPNLKSKSEWADSEGSTALSEDEANKIIRHAKRFSWPLAALMAKDSQSQTDTVSKYVHANQRALQGRALFRAQLENKDLGQNFLLLAWRKRVFEKAANSTAEFGKFDPLDIVWLNELVKLSSRADGPLAAKTLLQQKGIRLVVEPQIVGLPLDGAAICQIAAFP